MNIKNCKECKKIFLVYKSGMKRKFCSKYCYYVFYKGKRRSISSEFKKGQKLTHTSFVKNDTRITGKSNKLWKGSKASYSALHKWVNGRLGSPKKCKKCGMKNKKKYEWANIDHKYRRVLSDYIRLCTKCHREFDYQNNI